MVSFLIYLFCFLVVFFISKQEYKTLCFILVSLISVQLVLSYYASTERIHDVLFYLVSLSFIDLVMVICCISNNIIMKQHSLWTSCIALVAVFCTLLCIFDYYNFYYFQYAPMLIMEYLYFSIKPQQKFNLLFYGWSLSLVIPHIYS
ncbi:hypothetical protein BNCALIDO_00030 [Aeromonas phage vB_AdhM_TS9]|nr:hypothetical protein BNCALIDO_00030 [Aeromonas phage vB_AdhM_TS9]